MPKKGEDTSISWYYRGKKYISTDNKQVIKLYDTYLLTSTSDDSKIVLAFSTQPCSTAANKAAIENRKKKILVCHEHTNRCTFTRGYGYELNEYLISKARRRNFQKHRERKISRKTKTSDMGTIQSYSLNNIHYTWDNFCCGIISSNISLKPSPFIFESIINTEADKR